MIHNICCPINSVPRHKINWHTGPKLVETHHKFKRHCGRPMVVGTIDGIQISIGKPKVGLGEYFYFKTHDYFINYRQKWIVVEGFSVYFWICLAQQMMHSSYIN